jgi:GLPGLI family protein
MRRTLLALCCLLIPASAVGQEGRIAFQRAIANDFELPEEMAQLQDRLPSHDLTDMLLLFDASGSLMLPVPEDETARPGGRDSDAMMDRRMSEVARAFGGRDAQDRHLQSYVSFADGTLTETRELLGRKFRMSGPRPDYRWTLSGEQHEFLGYVVQKATAEYEGSTIEAWFTMQIPVPAGPGPYGGLPGMILVLSVDSGRTLYTATAVELGSNGDLAVAPPTDGDEVTHEEYEKIVAEKLEEIEQMRSARGRRRPF